MSSYHLAVDIGASSGRHMIGWLEDGMIHLKEIYRFENRLIIFAGILITYMKNYFRD